MAWTVKKQAIILTHGNICRLTFSSWILLLLFKALVERRCDIHTHTRRMLNCFGFDNRMWAVQDCFLAPGSHPHTFLESYYADLYHFEASVCQVQCYPVLLTFFYSLSHLSQAQGLRGAQYEVSCESRSLVGGVVNKEGRTWGLSRAWNKLFTQAFI